MSLLAILAILTSSAKVGSFNIWRTPDGIEIRRDSNRHLFRSPGGLTTLPITSLDGELLLIGHNEQITCFDRSLQRKWSVSGLEYMTCPGALVAGKTCFTYYNGPLALKMYPNRSAYLDASKKYEMIEARSYSGEFLWRKPWLDIGLPRSYFQGDSFITVRRTARNQGLTNIIFRVVDRMGSRKQGWIIAPSQAHDEELLEVVGWSMSQNDVIWRAGPSSKRTMVYELSEVQSSLELDLRPVVNGFRATITVSKDKLLLKILRPRAMTITAKPLLVR